MVAETQPEGCNTPVVHSHIISIYHLPFTIYYSFMDQAQSEFLVEIEELVEKIYVDLEALRDPELEGPTRREVLDRIFRRIHSVKGSSASCGLNAVSQIAHEFEDLLDA